MIVRAASTCAGLLLLLAIGCGPSTPPGGGALPPSASPGSPSPSSSPSSPALVSPPTDDPASAADPAWAPLSVDPVPAALSAPTAIDALSLALDLPAAEPLDPAGRPLDQPLAHPAFRGLRSKTGERLHATAGEGGLLLTWSSPDGSLRRFGVARLPQARGARLLGLDAADRSWLLVWPAGGSAETGTFVQLDADGRLLDRVGWPASPGGSRGVVAFAVEPATGALVAAAPADGGYTFLRYLPGRGPALVTSP